MNILHNGELFCSTQIGNVKKEEPINAAYETVDDTDTEGWTVATSRKNGNFFLMVHIV